MTTNLPRPGLYRPPFWKQNWYLWCGCAVCCAWPLVRADDPLPVVEDMPPAAKAPEQATEDSLDEALEKVPEESPETPPQTVQPKPQVDGLQSELEEQVLGNDAGEALLRQLDQLVRKMQSARERLAQADRSPESKSLQQGVVDDLDKLIRELEKPPAKSPPPPPQSSSPPPPMGGSDNQPQPAGGQKSASPMGGQTGQPMPQKQPAGAKPQAGTTGNAPAGEGGNAPQNAAAQSQDSAANTKSQQQRRAEEQMKQRLAKDVWGHLPPQLRQELLNVYSEKYLPKYEDMVRRYYEALADESRTR